MKKASITATEVILVTLAIVGFAVLYITATNITGIFNKQLDK